MMQYGNEPGGYAPPGNFAPPGGGPPPSSNPSIRSFPPTPRNPQNITSPPDGLMQQKNPHFAHSPGLPTPPNTVQNGPSQMPKPPEKQLPGGQAPYGGYYKPGQVIGNQMPSNVNQHPGQYPTPPTSTAQLANQMQGMNIGGPPTQPPTYQQGSSAVLNGPPGPQYGRNQPPPPSMSGQPPITPTPLNPPSQVNGQQYPPQINGSPSAPVSQAPGFHQGGQYMKGPPGGGPPPQGPPMNYGPPGPMRPPPSGPIGLAGPAIPSPNQTSGLPPPSQQHQHYQQPNQLRSPYSPSVDPHSNDNYQHGGVNQVHQGYPPTNQGYVQMGQQQQHGYNAHYANATSPVYPQQQQPAQRRLDPDQLPSPIQVMQDDKQNRSGIFYTNQKGLMPPLVTTNFVTQDQGNCSPRFVRSTMYNVPVTVDMMKQTSVPFALVISPLARLVEGEQQPPIVNMGEIGPVRCIRCKAYMSPYMQFIDGGRRFHCLFCKATTEVPGEYFQHLDHTGQRVDRFERPELLLGTYEFVATKDYCRNNQYPLPPAMIFVIDVSYNNMKSGLVHLLCAKMKEIIRNLPKEDGAEQSNMKVGFITYSTSVHFYNIKSCLAAPQMMVVGDVNEMFMPLLDGFLCDPVESETVIDLLMSEIPRQFADTRETETILYPAIQAGLEALKASNCAGKLLVFHSSLPIAEAPGKLRNRDDRKLLNTEKEKTVLAPQNTSYNTLGQDCVQAGCCVDLFIFNNSYVDIATIGQVSRLTGGEIFKYTYFQADIDGERFIGDLKRNVSRQIAFDSVMRIRTSTGVRATDFYGHFYMSNTTDMELAAIDCDKAIAVEIKHDDKLTEEDGVYIQVALLFTSCSGQRRLRVFNLSLKTCSQMADLYRNCDLDTIVNFFAKQGMFKLIEATPKQVKDTLVTRCATILACYRKNCASPSSVGQLILPECMKLLPLYVNTLMKSDAFSGGSDITCDDRSFAMHYVMIMDVNASVVYFYPRLIALHTIDLEAVDSPNPMRCTYEKLLDEGVYMLDNGIHMFIWLGLNAPSEFISQVFGVPSAGQVDTDKTFLPNLDNPLSIKIRNLIEDIRDERRRCMRLTLVRQRDKMEMVFKHFLMEDRGVDGSPSYVDFLCHMHKEIRNLLS